MQHDQDRTALQSELPIKHAHGFSEDSELVQPTAAPAEQSASHPMLVVVMGVSGCGKSTLGQAVAKALHLPFVDGDSLHPPSNIDKMSSGIPLTDDDRKPWLELIRTRAEHVAAEQQHRHGSRATDDGDSRQEEQAEPAPRQPHGLVVACSSLKRRYRSILRGHEEASAAALPEGVEPPRPDVLPTFFVYIKGERDELLRRMSERKGHFMKAEMLNSQLATLESPEGEEGVVTVRLEDDTKRQVKDAVQGLKVAVGSEVELESFS